MAVCLLYIVQKGARIYHLIEAGVDRVLRVADDIQELHFDCLFDVIRHGWVTLREMLARRRIDGEQK